MHWYIYKDLSSSEKDARRYALDSVGRNILLSQFTVLVVAFTCRLLFCARQPWIQSTFLRRLEWRLTIPLLRSLPDSMSLAGWSAMLGWFGWMVWLVMEGAGNDYLHLTKGFGMAAAANYPMHILLSMKFTPLGSIFGVSYEGRINTIHQALGKIICVLQSAHAVLYLKFFWDTSRMKTRLLEFDILCGVLSFAFLNIIMITSHYRVQRSYYRIFYIVHITISPLLFPILFLHVSHLRPYTLISLALLAFDRVRRARTRMQSTAVVRRLSGDVLCISINIHHYLPAPPRPVSHILFGVPGISKWTNNPFTVADFSPDDNQITIIVRIRNGFTKKLASLTSNRQQETKIPILLDMHYGTCTHYTGIHSQFERILIVTGGVGGAFAVPWIKYLSNTPGTLRRTRFIWAMRDTAALRWAVSASTAAEVVKEKAEVFLTSTDVSDPREVGEGVEMQPLSQIDREGEQEETVAELERLGIRKKHVAFGRPELDGILKAAVRGGSVALLVCGPSELKVAVRRVVGDRMKSGGRIWVHFEEFGS